MAHLQFKLTIGKVCNQQQVSPAFVVLALRQIIPEQLLHSLQLNLSLSCFSVKSSTAYSRLFANRLNQSAEAAIPYDLFGLDVRGSLFASSQASSAPQLQLCWLLRELRDSRRMPATLENRRTTLE